MSTPQPRKRCKAGMTSLFSTLTATKSYEKHEEFKQGISNERISMKIL